MGGFIILDDGRAYAAASWAYDRTVEVIAEALPDTDEGRALSQWLLGQRCDVLGPGLGSVDVRELTPANKDMLLRAADDAFRAQQARGPAGWHSPEFWQGWLGRFSDLLKMIESVRRGDSPDAFNPHMRGTIPPTGRRAGPGW